MVCVTEHWLSHHILDRIHINGYVAADAFCRASSRHGDQANLDGATYEPHLSDHRSQLLRLPPAASPKPKNEPKYRYTRLMNGKNTHWFVSAITSFDWTTILAPQAEVQYNNFNNTLMKILEESFPERKVEVIKRKKYKYKKSIKQLKNKVDAAGTIYRTKKDDNSKKLYEALKNKLREGIAESVKSGNEKLKKR
ncbi:hypothetical protein WA026_020986 [Henosepilachna vigintioctopunctata]|uniref:Uncharacterized protein n=1 Tax=Henosepilachna vigintioctopunctata TaxID=420089 RepID=A0AAW1VF49_9CUCU